jgi:hypothetical protein
MGVFISVVDPPTADNSGGTIRTTLEKHEYVFMKEHVAVEEGGRASSVGGVKGPMPVPTLTRPAALSAKARKDARRIQLVGEMIIPGKRIAFKVTMLFDR